MEDMEELHHRRLRSSSTTTSTTTSFPKFPPNPLDLSGFGGSPSRFPFRYSAPDSSKRSGIPPIPPSPSSRSPSANATPLAFHSRSLSQPAFFSLDSLPPLSPQPPPVSDVAVDDRVATSLLSPSAPISIVSGTTNDRLSFVDSGASFPPLKAHRRSLSDVPFGGFFLQQPSVSPVTAAAGTTPPPVPLPLRSRASVQLVKQESEWEKEENTCGGGDRKLPELDVADDLVNAYMNLDVLEGLNSSGAEDKREDLESSRFSGTRTTGPDSSENEAESSVNESVGGDGGGEKKEGRNKRTAVGDLEPVTSRHCRSLSMDSLMGKLHFGDESPKFPLSPGNAMGLLSHSGSLDGKTCRLEHGNGSNDEFNSTEMKKIMANEKLAEMALTDPKRVKRCF